MVPRYARRCIFERPLHLGADEDGRKRKALPRDGDRRGRHLRLPHPLRFQMERGVSAKGAFGATYRRTLPPRLFGRLYLAVFGYPHQRGMVGRKAAHDEQQGRRRRISKTQALL